MHVHAFAILLPCPAEASEKTPEKPFRVQQPSTPNKTEVPPNGLRRPAKTSADTVAELDMLSLEPGYKLSVTTALMAAFEQPILPSTSSSKRGALRRAAAPSALDDQKEDETCTVCWAAAACVVFLVGICAAVKPVHACTPVCERCGFVSYGQGPHSCRHYHMRRPAEPNSTRLT